MSWRLLRKCLTLLLVTIFIVPQINLFALHPSVALAATSPNLTGYDISPRPTSPGSTITFSYTISNPASSSQSVGLGASLRDQSGNWINDTAYDIVVSCSPGTSTKTRSFRIPNTATTGLYDVYWGLWSGTPGSSTQIQQVDRQDYLSLVRQPLQLVDSSCSVSPSTVSPGGRVTVTYRVYNPNTSTVTTALGCSIKPVSGGSWLNDTSHDTALSAPAGYSTQTRYFDVPSSASSGTYTVWWAIRDGSISGSAFDELQRNDLTVQGNTPPTISITSGPSGTISTTSATFQWQGSDSDGTISGYEYKMDGSGSSTGSTSVTFNNLAAGSHTFQVRCFDNKGAYSSWASRSFTISISNTPPTISITSGPSGTISTTSATFQWQGSDSDGTISGYEYMIDGSGSSTGSTSVTFNNLAAGSHTFQVRCFDNKGAYSSWATRSFTISISRQPLQLVDSSCSVSPSTVSPGGRVTVTYRVYNPNTSTVTTALGCSIKPVSGGSWLNDTSHDTALSAPAGYSTQTRYFDVPSSASSGTYTVWWAIRDGSISGSAFDELQRNDLTVVEKIDNVTVFFKGINTSVSVPITVDGLTSNVQTSAPISLSLASGTPHIITVLGTVYESFKSRFVVTDNTWEFKGSSQHTFTYKSQYLLNASTNSNNTFGKVGSLRQSGWYDTGTSLKLEPPIVLGYEFDNWLINGIANKDKTLLLRMEQPYTITAYYSPIQKTVKSLDTILYVRVNTDKQGNTEVTYVPYGASAEKVGKVIWAVVKESQPSAFETGKQVANEMVRSKWFYIGIGSALICAAPGQTAAAGAWVGTAIGPEGTAAGALVGEGVWAVACVVSYGSVIIGGYQVANQIINNLSAIIADSGDFYLVVEGGEGSEEALKRLSTRIGNLEVNGVEAFLLYQGGKTLGKQITDGALSLRDGALLQEKTTGIAEQVKAKDAITKSKSIAEQTKETGNDLSKFLKERQIAQMGNDIETALNRGTAGKITGFANDAGNKIPHSLERMLGRDGGVGVSDQAVIDAVNNPLKVEPQLNGRTLYSGTNAEVVLDMNGKLVTTWATSRAGYR